MSYGVLAQATQLGSSWSLVSYREVCLQDLGRDIWRRLRVFGLRHGVFGAASGGGDAARRWKKLLAVCVAQSLAAIRGLSWGFLDCDVGIGL